MQIGRSINDIFRQASDWSRQQYNAFNQNISNFSSSFGTGLVYTGAIATQLDSPAFGPADIIGAGMIGIGLAIGGSSARQSIGDLINNLTRTFSRSQGSLVEIQGYNYSPREILGGFDVSLSNPFNRFGSGLYINETPQGAAYESSLSGFRYRYTAQVEVGKIWDISGARSLSYKPISWGVGIAARIVGIDAIRFKSIQYPNTYNYAIIDANVARRARQELLP